MSIKLTFRALALRQSEVSLEVSLEEETTVSLETFTLYSWFNDPDVCNKEMAVTNLLSPWKKFVLRREPTNLA